MVGGEVGEVCVDDWPPEGEVGAVEGAVGVVEGEVDGPVEGVVDGCTPRSVTGVVDAEEACGRPNQPAKAPVATTAAPPSQMVRRRTRWSPRSRVSGEFMGRSSPTKARVRRASGKSRVRAPPVVAGGMHGHQTTAVRSCCNPETRSDGCVTAWQNASGDPITHTRLFARVMAV